MSLISNAWKWETGTPKERGEMIRSHASGTRPLPINNLLQLFCLTEEGLTAILAGNDWKPEYEVRINGESA